VLLLFQDNKAAFLLGDNRHKYFIFVIIECQEEWRLYRLYFLKGKQLKSILFNSMEELLVILILFNFCIAQNCDKIKKCIQKERYHINTRFIITNKQSELIVDLLLIRSKTGRLKNWTKEEKYFLSFYQKRCYIFYRYYLINQSFSVKLKNRFPSFLKNFIFLVITFEINDIYLHWTFELQLNISGV